MHELQNDILKILAGDCSCNAGHPALGGLDIGVDAKLGPRMHSTQVSPSIKMLVNMATVHTLQEYSYTT